MCSLVERHSTPAAAGRDEFQFAGKKVRRASYACASSSICIPRSPRPVSIDHSISPSLELPSSAARDRSPDASNQPQLQPFRSRLQSSISPNLYPIPILPVAQFAWSKRIDSAHPLDIVSSTQPSAAAAAAANEAASLTALERAQALQARYKWLESPSPPLATAAGLTHAASSTEAAATPSSQPDASSQTRKPQRPPSSQQLQQVANVRMRRSLEAAAAATPSYSGAAVNSFASSRKGSHQASGLRRISPRWCFDLISPEPTAADAATSGDEGEEEAEDDAMDQLPQSTPTVATPTALVATAAAAMAPVTASIVAVMDEESVPMAIAATSSAVSFGWEWLLPSQSIVTRVRSVHPTSQSNVASPTSSIPTIPIHEHQRSNGSNSAPVPILPLMTSNPPLLEAVIPAAPTPLFPSPTAPSKPVPSLNGWHGKLFAPIRDDDMDDFVPNSDASPIPVSPPRSSTKRVVAADRSSVQRAASSSSISSASVTHASPISTDGASTSDEGADDDDDDDEPKRCPLPWSNDVTGSPPPRYRHLTHNNEESAGYKALPRLVSNGCKCHSKGLQCALDTCACMQMGTAGYDKNGHLVAQDVRKSNIVYECNSQCGCGSDCFNRVLQRYPSFNPELCLELFMTNATAWGVRSSARVPGGVLIDEYMGMRKTVKEVMELEEDDESTGYMFDCATDALHGQDYPARQFLSQVKKLGFRSIKHAIEKWPRVTVDARDSGSIARFINHSCSPNVQAVQVFTDDRSPHAAHVVYFTVRDIPPKEEFVVDYNYDHRNVWAFVCQCGSKDCKNPPSKQRKQNESVSAADAR